MNDILSASNFYHLSNGLVLFTEHAKAEDDSIIFDLRKTAVVRQVVQGNRIGFSTEKAIDSGVLMGGSTLTWKWSGVMGIQDTTNLALLDACRAACTSLILLKK
jgi:hypothetical protein